MATLAEMLNILSYKALAKRYEAYGRKKKTPNVIWDKFFAPVTPEKFDVDAVEWVNLGVVRTPAPTNLRGQPSRMLAPTGATVSSAVMCRYHNRLQLQAHVLQMLRHPEQWVLQPKGFDEVNKQLEDFQTRNELTEKVIANKLALGKTVWVDGHGNLLESSSGSVYGFTAGIPSQNMGQLPRSAWFAGGSGNILSVSWADPAALMLDQLEEINAARQNRGLSPTRHLVAHTLMRKYFRNNAQVREWYRAEVGEGRLDNAVSGDSFKLGPNFTVWFDGSSYAPSAGGLDVPYVGPTEVGMFPDPAEHADFVLRAEGLELIPKNLDINRATLNPTKDFDEVYGTYSYTKYQDDPAAITMVSGSNFLNTLRAPQEVFVPTVVF